MTTLTAGAVGATVASIGLTFVKCEFALFDVPEKINRFAPARVNEATKRTRWHNQIRTKTHNEKLSLKRRFHDLDHRLTQSIKDVAKKLNKRIDRLGRWAAANSRPETPPPTR
ncbi:hypothetical protein [Streptomyces pratensis]|uniref:hypothetical protein n=1 Tax=Streptomyces pratensis TaxID=1169025 RepID=UPI003016E070